MHVILIPIGSAGDVHPFLGLGRGLRSRGHRVSVLTNDHFRGCAERLGLEFAALSSEEEFHRVLDDPLLWHPRRGFEFVAREGYLPLIGRVYRYLEEHAVRGQTAVAASSLAFGARIAQDRLGLPTVTVHLQPGVLPSLHLTPEFGGMGGLSRLPRPFKRILYWGVDRMTDAILAPEINRFRLSVGLGPVRRVLKEWIHSPLGTLGLFPEWFAPAQPDWPPKVRLAGFPLYDESEGRPEPPEIAAFLASGSAPVVFTAGSAMRQARAMFETSVEACQRLGCRGLLLSQFPDQLPSRLPPGVISASYAPFSRVFPLAAVVVHHGGIGTTAQALAAGAPQLVTPFAHDQFDNAARVERLGAGQPLPAARYRLKPLVCALRRLLSDEGVKARAKAIAPRLNGPQAVSSACDQFLEFAGS